MVIGGSLLSLATPWEHTAMTMTTTTTTTTTTSSLESLLQAKRVTQDSSNRSFYHLAAALAHRESDSLMGSMLLEADYQDCLLSFNARGQRLDTRKAKNQVIKTLNKILISQTYLSLANLSVKTNSYIKHANLLEQPDFCGVFAGSSFTPEEIAALILWASSDWHEKLRRNQDYLTQNHHAAWFHHELTTMAQRRGKGHFGFMVK